MSAEFARVTGRLREHKPSRWWFRCTGAEHLDQGHAGNEAANVRHERDPAARLRALADQAKRADQLEDEPHSNGDIGGHLRHRAQHEDAHAPVRVQHEIPAEDS